MDVAQHRGVCRAPAGAKPYYPATRVAAAILGDLLDRSRGENLGRRLFVGGRDFKPGEKVDAEFERRVVWL
jgi:hypothetical protein